MAALVIAPTRIRSPSRFATPAAVSKEAEGERLDTSFALPSSAIVLPTMLLESLFAVASAADTAFCFGAVFATFAARTFGSLASSFA